MQKNNKIKHDYTLHFSPIRNRNSHVKLINNVNGLEKKFGFWLNDEDFSANTFQLTISFFIADLVDLAASIYASDRLVPQELTAKERYIEVYLPVRNPEVLNKKTFQEKLEDLLWWTTGSKWVFHFRQREIPGRSNEFQGNLFGMFDPKPFQVDEVALWSGGLDAFAGLHHRLCHGEAKAFLLFGTGGNKEVYSLQGKVASIMQSDFPGRVLLSRLLLHFDGTKDHQKNQISRARGVVFTLLGSACALLVNKKELYIYENGIGAINLPYRKSAVGLDHTRSVHPLTLLKVSNLISDLVGHPFRIHNPFLFNTKAEMCDSLRHVENSSALVMETKSCDRPRRQKNKISQCGACSSCILRKQALAASRITDKTRYVASHDNACSIAERQYFEHMVAQASTFKELLNRSMNPVQQWCDLTQEFPELDDIVDRYVKVEKLPATEMQQKLLHLYKTYATEWDTVKAQISASLSNPKAEDKSLVNVQ